MTIIRPATRGKPLDPEQFISGAPDATKARGVRKGNRLQISLTIAPELLTQVDAMASKMGQSRAAVINMAIYRTVSQTQA